MALYEIHYTYGGDRLVYCRAFNGIPNEEDTYQALVEHLAVPREPGHASFADLAVAHGVTNVTWRVAP